MTNTFEDSRAVIFELPRGSAARHAAESLALFEDSFSPELSKEMWDVLSAEHPDWFQATGLLSPVTVITEKCSNHFRSYHITPEIFLYEKEDGTTHCYMVAPVGYDGSFFTPDKGIKLSDNESEKVVERLGYGGWGSSVPLISKRDVGAPLPVDFDPAKHHTDCDAKRNFHQSAYYLATDTSLLIALHYLDEQEQWKHRYDGVTRELGKVLDGFFKPQDKDPQEWVPYYLNTRISMDRFLERNDFLFSVHNEKDGRTLDIPENPFFWTDEPTDNGYRQLVAKDTPEGRCLKELSDHWPCLPQTSFYSILCAPAVIEKTGKTEWMFPSLMTMDRQCFWVYDAGKPFSMKPDAVPAGCIPVDAGLIDWIKADRRDKEIGITPPPLPADLQKQYERIFVKQPPVARQMRLIP